MVGVAQLVEHLVVAQVAVGSSPITHPIKKFQTIANFIICNGLIPCAPVAQLDRAPDFESVGRRFESCRAYQKISGGYRFRAITLFLLVCESVCKEFFKC